MRFLSVSHSANALLVRRGPFNPVESFVHAQNLKQTPPEKGTHWMYGSYALTCILFGPRAFLVLYLSSLHPLMSGEPESRPDYYLTCNRSTGGVLDTDPMFRGRLLTRNAWKLTNNGCETVVHRTKLMTYIFLGIIKLDFPVSLSPVQKRSNDILSAAHALHFRFTRCLSITRTVMSVNCPVHVRQSCSHCAFYALHTPIARTSSSSGDDFHHRITFCGNFSIRFYLCDGHLGCPARCDRCLTVF